MMVKSILLLTVCVLYNLHIVHSDQRDLKETCFREECVAEFHLGEDQEYCGSDGKPYPNTASLVCADKCAKKYGGEVHGTEGLCPDLPNAYLYWKGIFN
ncbi:hypothetical protein WA026_023044 [Henosepilachna vigintioctopunctata]|uniref:Secreted protein n=1 Tax=Henosepilachna vigintioctopunctata TaxID=420089 RepID=A0AAW1VI80_9CUCU